MINSLKHSIFLQKEKEEDYSECIIVSVPKEIQAEQLIYHYYYTCIENRNLLKK